MAELETLSIADYRHGTPTAKADFCANLLRSFATKGFVKIRHHGLSAAYIREGFAYNRALFQLSPEKRAKFAHPLAPRPHRGYSYVGQENISAVSGFERGEQAPPPLLDWKESFDCGHPDNLENPNVWPEEQDLPGFKAYMLDYQRQMHDLHLEIMSALALSLGLSADVFLPMHSQNASELRCLHYLAVPASEVRRDDSDGPLARRTRIAEHTDFGTLTLLMRDQSNGLEVLDGATGNWHEVACDFPDLTVNVGDSMMRLLNRRVTSACHRVRITTAGIRGDAIPSRYSIAYFGKPDTNASLQPLACLITDEAPAIFDDISGGEYESLKLGKVYATALPLVAAGS